MFLQQVTTESQLNPVFVDPSKQRHRVFALINGSKQVIYCGKHISIESLLSRYYALYMFEIALKEQILGV